MKRRERGERERVMDVQGEGALSRMLLFGSFYFSGYLSHTLNVDTFSSNLIYLY